MNKRNGYLISKALHTFMWASILSSVAQLLSTLIDAIVVSNLIGPDAISAVNVSVPVLSLVSCFGILLGVGGSIVAGIVGNNEGTVGAVRIAMCMMYGDMPGGTSPVYAGNHTSNASNFTEYNYWRSKANLSFTTYNDQLAIDNDEYLTRFPFYRHILNTHRELAAYFLFANNTIEGSVSDITAAQVEEIGHWSIDKSKAIYPIVEKWEKNTKKVLNAPSGTAVSVRKGKAKIGRASCRERV